MTEEMKRIWEKIEDHENRITVLQASLRGAIRDEVREAINPLVEKLNDHDKQLALMEARYCDKRKEGNGVIGLLKYIILALLFILAGVLGANLPPIGLTVFAMGLALAAHKPPGEITDESPPTPGNAIKTFLSTFAEAHAFWMGTLTALTLILVPGGQVFIILKVLLIFVGLIWYREDIHYFLAPLLIILIAWHALEVLGWFA